MLSKLTNTRADRHAGGERTWDPRYRAVRDDSTQATTLPSTIADDRTVTTIRRSRGDRTGAPEQVACVFCSASCLRATSAFGQSSSNMDDHSGGVEIFDCDPGGAVLLGECVGFSAADPPLGHLAVAILAAITADGHISCVSKTTVFETCRKTFPKPLRRSPVNVRPQGFNRVT